MIKGKGFSLLEMLVMVFIVSSLTVVATRTYHPLDLDYIYLSNDIISAHTKALTSRQSEDADNTYTNDSIYFNENGNVNKAQTISIGNHSIVIHLGNGFIVNE